MGGVGVEPNGWGRAGDLIAEVGLEPEGERCQPLHSLLASMCFHVQGLPWESLLPLLGQVHSDSFLCAGSDGTFVPVILFLITGINYPIKTSLRKAGLILAHGLGSSPSQWEGMAAGTQGCWSSPPPTSTVG